MRNTHIWQTLATGWMAGMRSTSALMMITNLVKHAPVFSGKTKSMQLLAKSATVYTINAMAALELIGDKLPSTPARTEKKSLIGRTSIGAISGAVIYSLARKNAYMGALLGGLTALASTYAMYELRKTVKQKTSAPDLPVALAEDALVVGTYLSLKQG